MSDKKRRKRQKKQNKQKKIGIIVVILIVYLFLKPIINVVSGGLKTTLPSKELLVESIEGQGFFIKNEKLVKSDVKGVFNRSVKEGERVSAGSEVANIDNLEDSSSLEREIIEIEQAIESLERSEAILEDIEKEGKDIEQLKQEKIEEIQNKIINKDYSNINIDKEELSIYDQKQNSGQSKDSLENETIEILKNRRDKIKEETDKNNIKYYTRNAGIISYDIDGFENLYSLKNLGKYDYKKLDSLDYQKNIKPSKKKDKSKEEIKADQAIYKLIDDFEWYLAIKIDELEDVNNLDENQIVKIRIDDEISEIRGKVYNINKSKNSAVVTVKFDTMIHKYYNKRVAMVELIKSKTNSLKIPKKSLIEKDGQKGVYIKNKGGIVEFRSVFEIKEIDDYVYLQIGDNSSNVYIDKNLDPIKTITLFDEIILSPKGVREGDILD